ncbi:MAG: hypothetical protein HN590_05205, partial [Calditrichaeota bacterium]|nr:hypothetical protein [Calditrichota bacterium]
MKRFAIVVIIILCALLQTSFGQDSSDVVLRGIWDLEVWGWEFWGTNDFCFYEDYLFATGWDNLLSIVDISEPENARIVCRFVPENTGIKVDVWGDYAYVSTQRVCFVIDVTDITSPQVTDTLQSSLHKVGDNNAISAFGSSILLYDLSTPDRPEKIDEIESQPTVFRPEIKIKDNYAFIIGVTPDDPENSGVQIWDLSDFQNPDQIANIQGFFTTIEVENDLLVAVTTWPHFILYSIDDPANPDLLASHNFSAEFPAELLLDNSKIYVPNQERNEQNELIDGINVWDVTNPDRPERTTFYTDVDDFDVYMQFEIYNGLGYLSKLSGSIEIIDFSDYDNVRSIKHLNRHEHCDEIVVTDNYALTTSNVDGNSRGARYFTLENDIPGSDFGYLNHDIRRTLPVVEDDFIAISRELSYWSLSDESSYEMVSSLDLSPEFGLDIDKYDDLMYVTIQHGFKIFDISDPENM